jgi:DNA-binding transcriptional LysR family regulator
MQLELRHLRYFLAVADELSFTRAAERLRVAQPALSAQIRQLERQFGCDLFARTTRKVELTAEGRLLLEDARDIVARADAAASKLAAAARGERGRLRVGILLHGASETGAKVLRRCVERCPEVEIEFADSATLEEGQEQVRAHVTDVCFAWRPIVFDDLAEEVVRSERKFVAMHEDHPLAAKTEVSTSDLAAEPIVAPWEHLADKRTLGSWLEGFRPFGRQPGDPNGKSLDECFSVVSRGDALYCVPESVPALYVRPHVVFRPIADAPAAEIVLIWHPETRNPVVRSFVEAARAVVAQEARSTDAIDSARR